MCGGVYWSRRGHGPLPSPVYLYSQVLLILFFLNGWGRGGGRWAKKSGIYVNIIVLIKIYILF